jgi:hypothetical protein
MNKTLLVIILSLVAGFAAGAWTTWASQPGASGSGSRDDMEYVDGDAPVADRIDALERIIAQERDARLIIEEQLQELFADLERIDVPELQTLLQQIADRGQRNEEAQLAQESRSRASRRGMRDYSQMRNSQLVSGGFTEARASQILQIEDQVRMDLLQAEYAAQLDGSEFNPWNQAYNYQATLRDQLGDADFEKYLRANGNQAAVTVREVIGSSPANRAGLRPGDQIVSYGGDRVFNMAELKSAAFSGDPGEDVIVDIERDGQRMQLVLPRGPIGITGSGAGMNFRYPFGG